MAKQTISAGSPPILWSTVEEAFEKINANFTELYVSIGGEGAIDFTSLESSLIPDDNDLRNLGSSTKRWKALYVTDNGISIGAAAISSTGTAISLPEGSTVGSNLIRDPSENAFKTISSPGQDDVSAYVRSDTLTLIGTDIGISTDSANKIITLSNEGIVSTTAGAGIDITGSNNITITNIGVTSLTSGLGLSVDLNTSDITIVNEGIVGIEAGVGISVGERSAVTGRVVITNTSPASGILAFRRINVSGQPFVDAQNSADILTLVRGSGIDINTNLSREITLINTGVTELSVTGAGLNVSSNTGDIVLSFDNRVDIVGSVFADDSSRLVDAENKQFFGDLKGSVFADDSSAMVNAIDNSLSSNTLTAITGSITDLSSPIFRAKDIYAIDSSGVNISANGFNNLVILETSVELQNVPVNIQNNLNVSGSITGDVTGDVTGSVFSDGSSMMIDGTGGKIVGPVENDSVITTALTTGKVEETVGTKTGATGTVVHDCAATHVFFHTSIAANFTANFTNLGLETGRATTVTLILNQGSPAYIPNAVQIGGAAQTIQWQASTPPSGNVNKTDIVSFSIVNDGGVYYVYGQLTTFGT